MNDSSASSRSESSPSEVEQIKAASRYLRGTIAQSLADRLSGALAESDTQLIKFHGSYQQDDRDLRNERQRQKLEPAYEFMIRVRATGGVLSTAEWLELDRLSDEYGNGSLRLTSRQSVQLHGILKWNLREAIRRINAAGMTTLATCGDVNRNVMCCADPTPPELHAPLLEVARRITERLLPRTSAYGELWLAQSPGARGDSGRAPGTPATPVAPSDEEPIYGATYLPRKFKIAIAGPPSNDVDVLTNDIGLIAIADGARLMGFNVAVGGGLGMTHGEPQTYPNLAWIVGFCAVEHAAEVAEAILIVQRDFGDRSNRKHARLKYTIADRGVEWFAFELARRLGRPLEPARPFRFETMGDRFGWRPAPGGRWNLTLYIENGRIRDRSGSALRAGLRAIAEAHQGTFRLTPNQNLIVAGVAEADRPKIDALAREYGLSDGMDRSPLRRLAMACVALPTCPLAMAESERYFPDFLGKLERLLDESGLAGEEILVRMTGCPNNCARAVMAEIGLVGKAVGKYNLHLGGDFAGRRLAALYRENIDEAEILESLRPVLAAYATGRNDGERFGDFAVRAGWVRAVGGGADFHAPR